MLQSDFVHQRGRRENLMPDINPTISLLYKGASETCTQVSRKPV